MFEAVDVITIIKGGVYDDLNLSVGEALLKRPEVYYRCTRALEQEGTGANCKQDFAGMYCCTVNDRLDTIFDTLRKSRVHRFVVVDDENHLKGILTLSDILQYILLEGESDEP